VQMNFEPDRAILTCIGEMKALDIPSGNILSAKNMSEKPDYKIIASNFIRPVHTSSSDFDKNGLTDYVICSFGHNKGGLYWLKQRENKTFETLPIRETAGATQSVTGDFNNDGWPDIMALFAHGDEGIWLFTNNQKGGFESKNILRFPPVYGSSSFQMADMNGDGALDIVYTAGDNSDYSRILKPYHGIYIFGNKGNFTFEKTFFYPVNGSTKAMVTDFNMDGQKDIAAIAFFADFEKKPSESFLYFENTGGGKKANWDFKPFAIPIHHNGRWICMDTNDYDGDGDQDIVLGNYAKGFLNEEHFQPNWNLHLPFVILENTLK
jgi:hypothetical protein